MIAASAAVAMLSAPAGAAAATFTWKGGAEFSEWAEPQNWVGGKVPSTPAGELEFPALTSAACEEAVPEVACYESENDLGELQVEKLAVDDGVPYEFTGEPIRVGKEGIVAAPSAHDCAHCSPFFEMGVVLGAPQTWSITGGSANQALSLEELEGSSQALTVQFASHGVLNLGFTAEVGSFTATGPGVVGVEEDLNGGDGNPVSIREGAVLDAPFGIPEVGPLNATAATVAIGRALFPSALLTVNGAAAFDPASTLSLFIDHPGAKAGEDFSQLSATGSVNLAGAHLGLVLGQETVEGKRICARPNVGEVDTLITAGSLSGTFAGIPGGTVIAVPCAVEEPGREAARIRIDYTATAVTATVEESFAEVTRHQEEAAARKRAEEAAAAAARRAQEEAAAAAARKHAEEEATAARKRAEEAARHPTVKASRVRVTAKGLVITLVLSHEGRVTVTGPGLKKTSRTLAAGTHKLTVPFTRAGRIERARRKRIRITITVKTTLASASTRVKVRL